MILQILSEVTASGSSYNGNSIKLISTPTTALPSGFTIQYAVTTENIAPTQYSNTIPSAIEGGTYYVWYKVIGEYETGPLKVQVTIDEYYYDEGDGSSWTHDSSLPMYFHIVHTGNDDNIISKFEGISVDDGPDVDRKFYEAYKGSVQIKLNADYLETFSVGEHKLTAKFTDGKADAKFTIVKGLVDPNSLPQTGDKSNVLIYALVGVLAVTGIVFLAKRKRI